eukprot:TRINITY_DN7123_c0_g1_i1.p1 TRINITY_DN7123_c0_g1~~TRINITY_DN7123_c0_g1_i1.p1  ORF type:complete len:1019 (-),score=329.08 TRINITY_DN7123_c0_g1_i1:32-3088(-)
MSASVTPLLKQIKSEKKNVPEDVEGKTCPVQVVVRCRPLSKQEQADQSNSHLNFPADKKEVVVSSKGKGNSKTYTFDHVYSHEATQVDLYNTTVSPIVQEVLKGFNCTIFAYGQTGTGKTFTMEGLSGALSKTSGNNIHPDAGIIPRSVHHIFTALEQSSSEYSVKVSFLEIYNEELLDLLAPLPSPPVTGFNSTTTSDSAPQPLKIFDGITGGNKGLTIQGLEEVMVNNADDIFRILEKGFKQRNVAETNMNKQSSRSHCIFTVIIHTKESTSDGEDLIKVGKLNLVDLAGSENIGRSGAVNQRKNEAAHINKSLLTLGRVITALTEHSGHIPYRESKLTRLLQDSLGGKTKTCVVATISPSNSSLEETMSTLDYAHRAKNIKNKPEVNQKMTQKAAMREYCQSIEKMKAALTAARTGDGYYITKEEHEEMNATIDGNKITIAEREEQIKILEENLATLEIVFTKKETELVEKTKESEKVKGELAEMTENFIATDRALVQKAEEVEDQKATICDLVEQEKLLENENNTLVKDNHSVNRDNNLLHEKIGRKSQVESENKNKASAFSRHMNNRVGAMQENISQFQETQTLTYGSIDSSLDSSLKRGESEMAAILSSVENMLAFMKKRYQNHLALMQDHQAAVSGHTSNISEDQTKHTAVIAEDLHAFFSEVSSTFEDLSQQSRQQQTNISQWVEEQKASADKRDETRKSFTTQQKNSVKDGTEIVRSFADASVSRIHNDQAAFEAMKTEQQQKLSAFEVSLQQMLRNFVAEQTQSLSANFESVQASLTSSKQDISGVSQRMQVHSAEAVASIDAFEVAEDVRSAAFVDELDNVSKLSQQYSAQFLPSVEHLTADCSAIVEKVNQREAEHAGRVAKHVELASTSVSQYVASVLESQKETDAGSDSHHKEISQQISKAGTSVADGIETVKKGLTAVRSETDNMNAKMNADLGEVSASVSTYFSGLKEDIPTGTTPVKKQPKPEFQSKIPKKSQQRKNPKADKSSTANKENTFSNSLQQAQC